MRCCAGTTSAPPPSAVNIRDSGDWITISADQQILGQFLDSGASTDATPPISGHPTLTAAECRDAKGQSRDLDVGRLTVAHPELHLQQFSDPSASANTAMLSTMYATACSGSAAAGQLPRQREPEAGAALPRADTRQGPQTRLPVELPASRARTPVRTQQASQCPGNDADVRPGVVGARAPKRPGHMPPQRTPPRDKQMTRQPATVQSSAKVSRGGTVAASPPGACPRTAGDRPSFVGTPPRGVPMGTARVAGPATAPKQDASRPKGAAPTSGLTRGRNTAQQQRSPWRPVSSVPEEVPPTDPAGSGTRHLQPSSVRSAVGRPVGPAAGTGVVMPKEGGPRRHPGAEGAGGLPRTRRTRDRDLKHITQDMQTLLNNRHQKYEAEVVASVTAGARLLADTVRSLPTIRGLGHPVIEDCR